MGKKLRSGIDFTIPLFPDDRVREEKAREFGTREFRQVYLSHLRSSYWRDLSRRLREKAQGKCSRCKLASKRLEVHHIHYETFGRETEQDVEVLCPGCHDYADYLRYHRGIMKFFGAVEEGRRRSALLTYMAKKYGEDFLASVSNPEVYEDEFEEWYQWRREREDGG